MRTAWPALLPREPDRDYDRGPRECRRDPRDHAVPVGRISGAGSACLTFQALYRALEEFERTSIGMFI